MRVLLGIASGGSPAPPFVEALGRLRLPPDVTAFERSLAFGNFVPAQRELIARDAIGGGYDFLFFVDDDIVLPHDALTLALETAARDPRAAVVGGLYYSRDSLRPMAVADWTGDDTTSAAIPGFVSTSSGIVDGVGFGCALLRVAALRELSPPYFPVHVLIERRARAVRLCDEDYRYCERVRNAGWHVRLDARVRCGHYDRASGTLAPVRWEDDAETVRPRMLVVDDARGATLVPFDGDAPRAREEHVAADVVYITVD